MSAHDAAVPLSAVSLRLTDEVGQAVLDWVAEGDLALSSALDQHVAAVRAALAACPPAELSSAWRAGQAAHHEVRARETPAIVEVACPDAPFADSPWHANATLPLRLLLHYACGFVEAAVRADWWPGEDETASDAADFESVRLAAVCRLVRQAEAAAAVPPGLR
jgi:Family of unknown function (DUF6401)